MSEIFEYLLTGSKQQLQGQLVHIVSLCNCTLTCQTYTLACPPRNLEAKKTFQIPFTHKNIFLLLMFQKCTVKAYTEVDVDWMDRQFLKHVHISDVSLMV